MDIRVYYEDTDAAGVVYHASYLKFFERARTEYFRKHDLFVAELANEGFVFPVVRMDINFKSPAKHDELLFVETAPKQIGGSSFVMHQHVFRKNDRKLLVDAVVTLACVNTALKAKRIPEKIRNILRLEIG